MRERVITMTSMSVVMVTILSLKGHLPLLTFHWNRIFPRFSLVSSRNCHCSMNFLQSPIRFFIGLLPGFVPEYRRSCRIQNSSFSSFRLIRMLTEFSSKILQRILSQFSRDSHQNLLRRLIRMLSKLRMFYFYQNLSKILFRILSGYSSKARRNPLRRLISVPVFSSGSSLNALQNPMRNPLECSQDDHQNPLRSSLKSSQDPLRILIGLSLGSSQDSHWNPLRIFFQNLSEFERFPQQTFEDSHRILIGIAST